MTETEILELNLANGALGLATLICFLMVAWATVSEVAERLRARWAQGAHDDHMFAVPELGLTMADGGEKVDEKAEETPKQ
ncbi:MAG: hypothetical protein ACXW5U_03425 [Thermoanaerobaculia bacterium]